MGVFGGNTYFLKVGKRNKSKDITDYHNLNTNMVQIFNLNIDLVKVCSPHYFHLTVQKNGARSDFNC